MNLIFADYGSLYMESKDKNEFVVTRWTSPKFRIYTTHCVNAKESDQIGDCSLHDYDFGEDLAKKYNINETILSSKDDCSKMCDGLVNCTFFSWKADNRKCQILNGLQENHWKQSNPPYFCQKNGTTVTEKEVLCKSVNQVIDESNSKHPFIVLAPL